MALAASSSALARALLLRGPGRAWGTGLQARCGGGGGPVNLARPAAAELAEQDELTWEDGTAQPEPCLDEFNLLTTVRGPRARTRPGLPFTPGRAASSQRR